MRKCSNAYISVWLIYLLLNYALLLNNSLSLIKECWCVETITSKGYCYDKYIMFI